MFLSSVYGAVRHDMFLRHLPLTGWQWVWNIVATLLFFTAYFVLRLRPIVLLHQHWMALPFWAVSGVSAGWPLSNMRLVVGGTKLL